jgi:hypothetical protein
VRKTYVIRDGKLVEKHHTRSRMHNVIGDIEPYESIITGEQIGGRRQHRDHLRDHGCIEVGNEQPKGMRNGH